MANSVFLKIGKIILNWISTASSCNLDPGTLVRLRENIPALAVFCLNERRMFQTFWKARIRSRKWHNENRWRSHLYASFFQHPSGFAWIPENNCDKFCVADGQRWNYDQSFGTSSEQIQFHQFYAASGMVFRQLVRQYFHLNKFWFKVTLKGWTFRNFKILLNLWLKNRDLKRTKASKMQFKRLFLGIYKGNKCSDTAFTSKNFPRLIEPSSLNVD